MKKSVPLLIALSAALLAGCATDQPLQNEPVPEVKAPVQLVDRSVPNVEITYSSEPVAVVMKVMNVRLTKLGVFPKLVFHAVNFTQTKFPIEYKVQWLDADGAPLPTSAPWLQTTLSGMEAKPLSAIGKSVDAKAVKLTVRFPSNVEIYVPTPDPMEKMRIERQVIDDYNARLSSGKMEVNP